MWFMKRFKVLVFCLLFLCSCGKVVLTPSETADLFLSYIANTDLNKAYSLLSPRVQNTQDFKNFKRGLVNPETGESVSAKNFTFTVKEEIIKEKEEFDLKGDLVNRKFAFVRVVVKIFDQPETIVRLPLIFVGDRWCVDSISIQAENPDQPGQYADFELGIMADNYLKLMMNGEGDKIWNMVSKRIKHSLSLEEFKSQSVGTRSGKTPNEEGFSYEGRMSYSDNDGNGVVEGVLMNNMLGIKDLQFKAKFVKEGDEWKADFARLDAQPQKQPQK